MTGTGGYPYLCLIPDPWVPCFSGPLRLENGEDRSFVSGLRQTSLNPISIVVKNTPSWSGLLLWWDVYPS